MKKILFSVLFLSLISTIFAAEIELLGNPNEFLIYNRRNSKIYNYILLLPGEQISCRTSNVDSLEVYSRFVNKQKKSSSYNYEIEINKSKREIKKSSELSTISRGIKGEKISKYNKFKTQLPRSENKIKLLNNSELRLIFKLDGTNIVDSNLEIDYIRFTPNFYNSLRTLTIDKKEYTYYTSSSGSIKLTLQGPIYLKVISRLLFDNNIVNKRNYRFQLFDNRKLINEFTERAYKSQKAWMKEDLNVIPSTGDVNIIKLSPGIHHIEIKDNDINRDLIFRFYINKSAVGIERQ